LKKVENKNLIPIYKLLFYTGLRANELLSLHWSNVDLASKIIRIKNENGFQTKTHQDKTLPLNEKALAVLISINHKNKNGLIFTRNKIKLNVDYVSKQFKKAIRETKLNQNLHLHSLRHSFASNLVAKGASLYHVSKLLSHSRISTTEKYSHVNMKELREASEFI
jgi:integrase/recombinase XerC